MGRLPNNWEVRKADEVCDYCYHNRVLLQMHHLGNYSRIAGFESLDVKAHECICSMTQPCHDVMCNYNPKHFVSDVRVV